MIFVLGLVVGLSIGGVLGIIAGLWIAAKANEL